MEPDVVQPVFPGCAQPLQPCVLVHGRVAGQRKLRTVDGAAQRNLPPVQIKFLILYSNAPHTEFCFGTVNIITAPEFCDKRVLRGSKLIPTVCAGQRQGEIVYLLGGEQPYRILLLGHDTSIGVRNLKTQCAAVLPLR